MEMKRNTQKNFYSKKWTVSFLCQRHKIWKAIMLVFSWEKFWIEQNISVDDDDDGWWRLERRNRRRK